jgi:hypothetical protein
MQLLDVLALLLLVGSAAAFLVGALALSRAEDVHAFYWLVVGVVSLRASVQIARPGSA